MHIKCRQIFMENDHLEDKKEVRDLYYNGSWRNSG
jgi:hypothetical protein